MSLLYSNPQEQKKRWCCGKVPKTHQTVTTCRWSPSRHTFGNGARAPVDDGAANLLVGCGRPGAGGKTAGPTEKRLLAVFNFNNTPASSLSKGLINVARAWRFERLTAFAYTQTAISSTNNPTTINPSPKLSRPKRTPHFYSFVYFSFLWFFKSTRC